VYSHQRRAQQGDQVPCDVRQVCPQKPTLIFRTRESDRSLDDGNTKGSKEHEAGN